MDKIAEQFRSALKLAQLSDPNNQVSLAQNPKLQNAIQQILIMMKAMQDPSQYKAYFSDYQDLYNQVSRTNIVPELFFSGDHNYQKVLDNLYMFLNRRSVSLNEFLSTAQLFKRYRQVHLPFFAGTQTQTMIESYFDAVLKLF